MKGSVATIDGRVRWRPLDLGTPPRIIPGRWSCLDGRLDIVSGLKPKSDNPGAIDGGSWYLMSNLIKANDALTNLRIAHVPRPNLSDAHVTTSNLINGHAHVGIFLDRMSYVIEAKNVTCHHIDFSGPGP